MKPLVLWCRWHNARLRLHGRAEDAVWGELVFPDRSERFRYDLARRELALGAEPDSRRLLLDEMGVERDKNN